MSKFEPKLRLIRFNLFRKNKTQFKSKIIVQFDCLLGLLIYILLMKTIGIKLEDLASKTAHGFFKLRTSVWPDGFYSIHYLSIYNHEKLPNCMQNLPE